MEKEKKISIEYEGKYVGNVIGDKYYTTKTESQIFRKYNAVCISDEVVEKAKLAGANKLVFKVIIGDETNEYTVKISDLEEMKQYDYGGDLQWVLPLKKLRSLNPLRGQKYGLDDFIDVKQKKEEVI